MIILDSQGNLRSASGETATRWYAMKVLAASLELYGKSGISPSRHITPSRMIASARKIDPKIKARDYVGAAAIVRAKADQMLVDMQSKGLVQVVSSQGA